MKRCPAGEGYSIYKEVQMIYTFPHYYNHFKCTASGCPDTCCAGWGIMIDREMCIRDSPYRSFWTA